MWCLHRWNKWSDPVNGVYGDNNDIGYLAVTQIRICGKCGLAEVKRLPKLRSIEELKRER